MRKNIFFLICIFTLVISFKEGIKVSGPPVYHFISKYFNDTNFINQAREKNVKTVLINKLYKENGSEQFIKEAEIIISDEEASYISYHNLLSGIIGATYFINSKNYFLNFYALSKDSSSANLYKKEKYTFSSDEKKQKSEEAIESILFTGRKDTSLITTTHKYLKTGNYILESISIDRFATVGKDEGRTHQVSQKECVTMIKDSGYELTLNMGRDFPHGSYIFKDEDGNITETGKLEINESINEFMIKNNLKTDDPESHNYVYKNYLKLLNAGKIKEKRIPEISYTYQNKKMSSRKILKSGISDIPSAIQENYFYDLSNRLIKIEEHRNHSNSKFNIFEITYNNKGLPDKIFEMSNAAKGTKILVQSFEYKY